MKHYKESIMKGIFLAAALTSILAVLLICIFLFANGASAIQKIGFFEFIFGGKWKPNDIPPLYGIFPMIVGSVMITFGAVLFGVPIGILTAVFMANYCPKNLYKFLKPAVELLAGIPSVVYGFFGLVVLVPFVRSFFGDMLGFGGNGNSIFTAALLLGIMILPTILGVSEAAIRAVPKEYYEGALALGSTHERAIFSVVLPATKSGVMASIVLGVGRAIGETMAVIMVAGNQPRITGNIFKGIRTMTANIVMEMGYAADLHREALIATGVVLFIFILAINLVFNIIKRREKK